MSLPFQTRLSITGMAGLAALSATHWLRRNILVPGDVLGFVLGVLPNLAAGFAMPLIVSSIVPGVSRATDTIHARSNFLRVLLVTTAGLFAWEVLQARSARFVFDPFDLAATVLGATLAFIAFRIHARRGVREPT